MPNELNWSTTGKSVTPVYALNRRTRTRTQIFTNTHVRHEQGNTGPATSAPRVSVR